jgi:hypothetical protein
MRRTFLPCATLKKVRQFFERISVIPSRFKQGLTRLRVSRYRARELTGRLAFQRRLHVRVLDFWQEKGHLSCLTLRKRRQPRTVKFRRVLSYPRCRASNRRDGERETR